MRKKVAIALVIIAVGLAGIWVLPYMFPDQDLGLNELSQLSGIVSLPIGAAGLVIGMWDQPHRAHSTNDQPTERNSNSFHGKVSGSGQVIQSNQVNIRYNKGGHDEDT